MGSLPQETEIDEIFRRLQDAYAAYSKAPNGNVKTKIQLRNTASELASVLQSPQEAAAIFAMSTPIHVCYRAAGDCGILTPWAKEIMSADELAKNTGADARLIVRLMRTLTAYGIFTEKGEELYCHNKLSSTLSVAPWLGMVRYMAPGMVNLPQYLAHTSYKNPGSDGGAATPFQYGNNTPLSFYQALAKDDKARAGFDYQMKQHIVMERALNQNGFASIYDFEGELGPLIESEDEVALVDVGGSGGHVLEDIKQHLTSLKGRLILEELPETLQSVKVPDGIEAVPYNFIESEQPIKGAACYLFRQIFLNWNDANGLIILRNTLSALKPGYSRILIMEMIPPPVGAPLQAALMDMQMAQMGGGLRSEKRWRAFLDEAGFEVKRVLRSNSAYSVIEAVPKV